MVDGFRDVKKRVILRTDLRIVLRTRAKEKSLGSS